MGRVVKLLSIHKDYGVLTRAHMMYAREYLGTDRVGWFEEDLYNTHAIVFFDANQYTIEQAEGIYAPYRQMDDSKETKWVHQYQAMFGWEIEMIFDLDNPTVSGVLDEVNPDKNCLVIEYMDTQWIPIGGRIGNGILEVEDDTTHIWREHDQIPMRKHLMAVLPDWQWGDVETVFWYQSNGNKDEGYVYIDERGRVTEAT